MRASAYVSSVEASLLLGLGHEHFHPNWGGVAALEKRGDIHWTIYQKHAKKYTTFNDICDLDSIMIYSTSAFDFTDKEIEDCGLKTALNEKLSPVDIAALQSLYGNVGAG